MNFLACFCAEDRSWATARFTTSAPTSIRSAAATRHLSSWAAVAAQAKTMSIVMGGIEGGGGGHRRLRFQWVRTVPG